MPSTRQGEGIDSSLTVLRKNQPCQYPDLDLDPPEWRHNKFLLFKPPPLWHFVMAALADEYTWFPQISNP